MYTKKKCLFSRHSNFFCREYIYIFRRFCAYLHFSCVFHINTKFFNTGVEFPQVKLQDCNIKRRFVKW